VAGEKVVLRLLASHHRQFGLTDLGMTENDLNKVRNAFTRPYGMILSTGPTGSGKTTSMYAVLKILNVREKNIATIEDPVEYEIEGINQIQANTKTNLTFANGLRSILRQDPDIIYVGEIRDEETADIAINAATTGHLVLSTLHTNDAATTLPRLIDMGIEPFLVSSTVNAIISQRLVRRICDRCKMSVELTKSAKGWQGDKQLAAQFTSLDKTTLTTYFGASDRVRLYQGKGCVVCHNTGYLGRVGIFEILEVTPAIQALIVGKSDSERIMQQAIKEGMSTMMHDGLTKVARGITTLEEILRAATE
jgi:type II secretory ATPase GspE/PulE/Tfp pilus assembly ATPase PilB-like protein